jgi:hypothetical protein
LIGFIRQSVQDRRALTNLVLLASIITLYQIGLKTTFPFIDRNKVADSVESVPLIALMDALFSGGALKNAGLFLLGILPVMMIMNPMFRAGDRRFPAVSLSRLKIFVIAASIAAILLWLRYIEAAPDNLLFYTVFSCYLLLGFIFLIKIEAFLIKNFRISLLHINASLIIIGYLRILFSPWQPSHFVVAVLLIALALSMVWLSLQEKLIHLVNIRQSQVSYGILPIPVSNTVIRLILPLLILFATVLVSQSLNVLLTLQIDPYSNSRIGSLTLILVSVVILISCASSKIVDSLLSQFSAVKAAIQMKLRFWIVPGIEPDKATVDYLSTQVHQSMRINYYFFLVWVSLLCTLNLINAEFRLGIPPLSFGVPGFLVAFVLCIELIYKLGHQIYSRLQLVSVREFWSLPMTNSISAIPVEPASFQEVFEQYMPLKNDEERRLLQELRNTSDETPTTPLQIIVALSTATIAGLGITALVAIVMERISPGMLSDSTQRAQLLAVWIGIQLSMIPLFGVDQDIRAYIRQQRRKRRP